MKLYNSCNLRLLRNEKNKEGGEGKTPKKNHLYQTRPPSEGSDFFFFKPLQKLFFVQMPYDLYEFKNLEIKVILNKGLL